MSLHNYLDNSDVEPNSRREEFNETRGEILILRI